MDEKYVSGYPPPPYYYEEYENADLQKYNKINDLKNDEDSSNDLNNNFIGSESDVKHEQDKLNINTETLKNNDNNLIKKIKEEYEIYDINDNKNIKTVISDTDLEKYNKENCTFLLGRPPPITLKNCYNIFGINYDVERKIEQLEPDDLLYNKKKNLKEEFITLYKNYKDCFFSLFDDVVNNRKNDKTHIKNLIKIHINLFHILANLRHHQSVNNIINVLKVQLKRRQIVIDKMKISLLNVYNYINYVQTNSSKIKMVKNEEKNTKKKKAKLLRIE